MSNKNVNILNEVLRVLRLEGNAILNCARRLEQNAPHDESLNKALQIFQNTLVQGGKIVVTGLGKSGKVGQKIAATLCSTGSLAVYLHPTEGLHGDLGVVTAKDAVLALSYTGNTDDIVKLVPNLKHLKVPVVAIVGNPHSRLAQECDVILDGHVEQEACPHNLAPTASTTLALAIGDAITVALMQLRGFDADAFAQNHPGGALGNRFRLKVEDLMQKGENVGTLRAEASMDEVIVLSTQKKQGAVLVVENPTASSKLLGIITDGDIRRALGHREKFFTLKAGDVMTRNPVTIQKDSLAKAALDLMENRPSQISVLPVVDHRGNWEGLIRLHDLARTL